MIEPAPVRKTVRVSLSKERAYALFTRDIALWWPLETHKVSDEEVGECFFEDEPGGRIYERDVNGVESTWGSVVNCRAPDTISFTWHPGRPAERAQNVELVFREDGDGTIVELEHTGWFRAGDGAAKLREGYDSGWDFVLGERYVGAAAGPG